MLPPEDVDLTGEAHRGRASIRRLMWDNSGDLWTLYRAWTHLKHWAASVPSDDLKADFDLHLNPPEEIPVHFDTGLYALNHLTARAILTQ